MALPTTLGATITGMIGLYPMPILNRDAPAAQRLAAAAAIHKQLVLQASVFLQLLFGLDDVKRMASIIVGGYALAGLACVGLVQRYAIAEVAAAFLVSSLILVSFSWLVLRTRYAFRVPLRLSLLVMYSGAMIALLGVFLAQGPVVSVADAAARAALCVVIVAGYWPFLESAERQRLWRVAG